MKVMVASFISDFWNDQLVEHDRQWLFLVLLGLLLSFGFIRLSTRLMRSPRVPWWPGSVVSDSGVHVHHLVFGIVLMMIAGTLSFGGFATNPIYEICAFAFGVGMGLTIDEFALWVYLTDVYWAKEGRSSVDAAVIAVTAMSLVLLGIRPFEFDDGNFGAVARLDYRGRPRRRRDRDLLHEGAGGARDDRVPHRAARASTARSAWASRSPGGPGGSTVSATRRSRPAPSAASTPAGAPSASRSGLGT